MHLENSKRLPDTLALAFVRSRARIVVSTEAKCSAGLSACQNHRISFDTFGWISIRHARPGCQMRNANGSWIGSAPSACAWLRHSHLDTDHQEARLLSHVRPARDETAQLLLCCRVQFTRPGLLLPWPDPRTRRTR